MSRGIVHGLIAGLLGVALVGCASSASGPFRHGLSREEIRSSLGEPAARTSELTGDEANFCLSISGKRPELVEHWTYIIGNDDKSNRRALNIYFDKNGKLFGTMTSPATQPSATQP